MDVDDFDFEFHAETEQPLDHLREETERRLRALAEGHTDMVGADVVVEQPAEQRATPYVYRARIVAYIRPENIAADKQSDTADGALKAALDALERQVRERREKLRERWKQH